MKKYRGPWWEDEGDLRPQARREPTTFHNLPPWSGDNDRMERWVNEQLGKRELVPRGRGGPDAAEIYAAEHGDLDPLKRKYPHLAPYLHLPKRARGKRFQKPRRDMVLRAAADAMLIRALWQKAYGKKNRRQHEGEISAEEIAARRWDVEAEEVRKEELEHGKKARWFIEFGYRVGKHKQLP